MCTCEDTDRAIKGKSWERSRKAILIAAENNAITIHYVKTKINNVQKNNKCRLCRKRDKMINQIVSKCNKLT